MPLNIPHLHFQAVRLKAMYNEGKLNMQKIYSLMAEPKANQREKITFQYERMRKYFSLIFSKYRGVPPTTPYISDLSSSDVLVR